MQTTNRKILALVPLLLGLVIAIGGQSVIAQTGQVPGVTVQLPVFRTFGVRTAVSVPDGGTINLGGVGRSSYGQSNQSGFGRLPSSNRFRNNSPSGAALSVRIIRLKELERQMLADHAAGRPQPDDVRVNGSRAVQAKADFISRHVGR